MNRRIIFFLLLANALYAQDTPLPSTANARLQGYAQRGYLKESSQVKQMEPVSIGPSVFSCRVTDVDVNPKDPTEFYVAYASGGLWYTHSNGTAFEPVFDHEMSMTIGDIAVDWKRNIVWVGTGEVNSSRSSYAGTGLYRSTDGGKSWNFRGLPESHHIARIVLDPENPDRLWVAVLGHLYSPNPERGIFLSTDGGKQWEQTLYVNDNSGAIDLCRDPLDGNTLYAASWERVRSAWNFSGAGEGSGIWKSTDGGSTWARINTKDSGFPFGPNVGRIGLCAGSKDGKTVLYASLDNQSPKAESEKKPGDGLSKDVLRTITKEDFMKLPEDKLAKYLKQNDFPEIYTAQKVREMVASDKIKPQALVEYLEDANFQLFNANYIGAEVYRSDDGGQHWYRTHTDAINGINFTYGYYFSTIYCLPNDADQVYLLGYLIIKSQDGGKSWKSINGDNVHVDHHALWVDPARPGHLINGNDGGLNLSWDNGTSWMKANNPPVGQFYAVAVDQETPFNVYGGAQDNGVWVGPSDYEASSEWHQTGRYPYEELLGGDGMQIAVDTRDNNTVYTGFQFGNYFRIDKKSGKQTFISPQHELGERPLRFNWQTPILLSVHNLDILYMGAQKLYRSMDQGDHWEAISGDLTAGGKPGNVPYGTLSSISESPLQFGLLYTGSDDGQVHVSRDGGFSWTSINAGLPAQMWVSRVEASNHEKSRVYLSLNGYRWDDFSAYLFVSDDYGAHWKQIGADLPLEPINVVREDTRRPNVLYVGTDHGLYVSLDAGAHFSVLGNEFPAVAVHDLAIQRSTGTLVIGTHGRAMYKLDINNLQAIDSSVLLTDLFVFDLGKVKYSPAWGRKADWREINEPDFRIGFFVSEAGAAQWRVSTKDGVLLNEGELVCTKGYNELRYGLNLDEASLKKYQKWATEQQEKAAETVELKKADNGQYYLLKGNYIFELQKNKKSVSKEFSVK